MTPSRRSPARGGRRNPSTASSSRTSSRIRWVNAADFVAVVVKSPVPVLVAFHAGWCAPCQAADPRLRRLAGDLADAARIVKIDADREKKLLARQRVSTLPTWILFQGGKELLRGVGPSQIQRVERRLRSLLDSKG